MVRTTGLVLVAALATVFWGTSVARAESAIAPQLADPEAAAAANPPPVWYELQTAIPDATAVAMATAGLALCGGSTCKDVTLGIATTVFVLGGGVVHLAHRNPRSAILGSVAKVALPTLGYALGRAIGSCDPHQTFLCSSDGESLGAAFAGVVIGVILGSAIDIGLSTGPGRAAEHAKVAAFQIVPTVVALPDRASVGLVGRF
jgi:hypothetical protein